MGCHVVSLDAVVPDGVWIFTNWGYDGARVGLFYAMRGTPQDVEQGNLIYRSIGGQWYIYSDHRWPPRPLGTPPSTMPCAR